MDILNEIEDEKLKQGTKCWWCGSLFEKGSIWSDSNKNGIELKGFKEKQLLFLHCTNCDNNTSLTKILAY